MHTRTHMHMLAYMQVRNVPQQFKYTEPIICTNPTCGNRKAWSLVREESVFVDWQRIKVQEDPGEVPGGSLPRTMDVIVRHDQVRAKWWACVCACVCVHVCKSESVPAYATCRLPCTVRTSIPWLPR